MVILATGIKMFLVDWYKVPSGSMQRCILPGDYILINKLAYGPKWPESPLDISWFNLLALNDLFFPWFKNTKWPYFRWPEGSPISRDDIIVFESPKKDKAIIVKRCKGLPGDLIYLKKDKLYINDSLITEPETVIYTYNSPLSEEKIYKSTGLFLNSELYLFSPDSIIFRYLLHPDTANYIQSSIGETTFEVKAYEKERSNYYGPIIVPKKGLTINLQDYLHELEPYMKIIEEFEGTEMKVEGDVILINEQPDSLFTFENNYYFMMGDNRHGSQDSRKWGFVPENNIIGKVILIVFSRDERHERTNWGRMFKNVE